MQTSRILGVAILAALLACVQPSPRSSRTAAFQRAADQVAARNGQQVVAWGEAMLSDDGTPRRYAVLQPDELVGRGAYLIEDRPGRAWLVTFEVDGRTLFWGLAPDAPRDGDATWQRRLDTAVDHEQGHRHGGERLVFALRGGAPVVLEHDYLDDVEEDVVERQRFEVPPPLDGFEAPDLLLEVEGPAPASSLGVPPPPPTPPGV